MWDFLKEWMKANPTLATVGIIVIVLATAAVGFKMFS